ncbi:protein MAIN-LIKE 1-like [Salvia divinorum]|uniref:Protein MAIN-LIKE 1-like n=1 Tax=Salvia divinorum TaxID=28513 RepID=A0ABD1G9H7_SALDI
MRFGGILRCVGEATVTLKDVEVLWCLKVYGDAVTGYIPTKDVNYWMQTSLDFLRITPSQIELKELVWKQRTLSNQLRIELSDDEEDYIYV